MADRNRQLLDFLQDNTDRRYDTDEESNFSGFSDGGESDVEVPVFDLDDLSSESSDDSDHDEVQNQNMEWTGNFTRPVFDDFTEQPGAKLPDDFDTATATPLDYFYLLMQPQLFVDIARHTNNYARWKLASENRDLDPRWEETGANEMRAFVGLNVLFGMNRLPRLEMHWSKDRFIGNQGVQDTMTCNRYQKLNQYFHVSDRENEPARDSPQYDGLYKVRPVLDHCTQTFQEHYTLSKECVVDEAMIKFQGRHSAKQYMPAKPVKWGIKVWSLCDSRTYYLSKFQIYEGRRNNATEHGLGYNVVRNMTSEIRNSNRHVYFDNYFTSIPLMETLLQDGLYACGTIRTNRKEYPPQLKKPRDVSNRGEFKILQRGRSNLTASVWKDRKLVHNVSTLSDPAEVLQIQRRVHRQVQPFPVPHCVKSYNLFMGGVDKNDQYRAAYDVGRSSRKWWRYIFWYLVNSAIVNAWFLYDLTSTRRTSKKRFDSLDFRLELRAQLIGGFTSRKRKLSVAQAAPPVLVPQENIGGHIHGRLPGKRRRCRYHNKVMNSRVETVYGCTLCQVPLCQGCHALFHNNPV